jgi:hypothetical protein
MIGVEDLHLTYRVDLSGGQRRLKEATLYAAQKSQRMDRLGGIKLNKILWRSDFRSFYARRQPVTGRTYQRLKFGPAPIEMVPVLAELHRDGLLVTEQRKVFDKTEHRPVPQADPVLNFFSQEDLDYLDESIQHYWSMTGAETSDESHGIAWRSREDGDPIPYEAAYFEDAPLGEKYLGKLAEQGRGAKWLSA